jgi:toxin ParE1/3/4
MARVIVSEVADEDLSRISARLAHEAGSRVARKYGLRFERLFELIAQRPEICAARPRLGPFIRVGVVFPYVVIYRHIAGEDIASVLRVVDGRRNIVRSLLP